MNKVICDVCGTTFPETSDKCPICGCAKSPAAQTVTSDDVNAPVQNASSYNYVKGGRFSKANVKRNNRERAQQAAHTEERKEKAESLQRPEERKEKPEVQRRPENKPAAPQRRRSESRPNREEPQQSNKGLIAVVIVLLLAIIMVVIYIGVTVFLNGMDSNPNIDGTKPSVEATTDPTDNPDTQTIPCTDITLGSLMVEFNAENETYLLEVRTTPENTTENITFESSDNTVAIVDQNGLITPVNYGQTTIKVTCGQVTKECTVICTFGEPTESTEATQTDPIVPPGFVLELNRKDFTLSKQGEKWSLFKDTASVKASDITWSVDDPAVATVENGVVVGVGKGTTTVTAVFGDQSVTCIVRCTFETTTGGGNNTGSISISHTDVTLKANESFTLILKNTDGSKVQDVEWTASEEGCLQIDGTRITALTVTEKKVITVTTVHDGVTYSCTIRLYPSET